MSDCRDFRPDWASAPGDTIVDILRDRAITEDDFAQRIGHTRQFARDLLEGRATITIALARQLEISLGASVEFWMARDYQYRQDVGRLQSNGKEWVRELPIGDMIKFGWLSPVPRPSEEVASCLQFFGVPNVSKWSQVYKDLNQMAVFRKSAAFESRPAAVAAWLRRGEIEAKSIDCEKWDSVQFKETLLEIRSLTRVKDPGRFVPALRNLCADSGVAVTVVRAPNGCSASGATKFLSPNKALLQLSFRFLTDDHFWFTFFHEAGHLILHGKNGFFLEGSGMPSTTEEDEANEFAARILVPSEYQTELLKLRADSRKVIKFARRLGVSPGIIVGQLQHYERIQHSQLNRLKRRYEWSIEAPK